MSAAGHSERELNEYSTRLVILSYFQSGNGSFFDQSQLSALVVIPRLFGK